MNMVSGVWDSQMKLCFYMLIDIVKFSVWMCSDLIEHLDCKVEALLQFRILHKCIFST